MLNGTVHENQSYQNEESLENQLEFLKLFCTNIIFKEPRVFLKCLLSNWYFRIIIKLTSTINHYP